MSRVPAGGGYSLVYRGLWHGTPVAIKRWFNPQLQEDVQEEFRWGSSNSLCSTIAQYLAVALCRKQLDGMCHM
jgi:hypothetical protein